MLYWFSLKYGCNLSRIIKKPNSLCLEFGRSSVFDIDKNMTIILPSAGKTGKTVGRVHNITIVSYNMGLTRECDVRRWLPLSF